MDMRLQALGVPVVLLDALAAGSASSRTREADATALAVLLSTSTSTTGGRSRLSDGGKGSLGWGSSLGGSRGGNLGRGRSSDLGGGGSSGRRLSWGGSTTSTVPELGSWHGVARVGAVEVEVNTRVLTASVAHNSTRSAFT